MINQEIVHRLIQKPQMFARNFLLYSYFFKIITFQSPYESAPTLKFPSRSESVSIRSSDQQIAASKVIKKIPVVFRYTGKNCKDVFLIGSFTNWKEKISTAKSDGDYMAIVDLPEGEHQYKFVVDGKWEHDPTQVPQARIYLLN